MTARTLMSAPVHTCQPDTNLATVAQLMWDHDCGFVPVVDAEGHVAGVVTDRDICIASATRHLRPARIPAAEAMSSAVYACLPDDRLDDVLATMSTHQIRRLPVIDATGHLLGVVSLNDLVLAVGRKGAPTATTVVAAMAGICGRRPVATVVA